jgi:hypothetical protein
VAEGVDRAGELVGCVASGVAREADSLGGVADLVGALVQAA